LIKADEQLSIELWDSDRSSADDIVGKVELSMQKMIQHPGKMYPQVSKLKGLEADPKNSRTSQNFKMRKVSWIANLQTRLHILHQILSGPVGCAV